MNPGDLILMEGYSLQEAMSAVEIGEPRLDSGLGLPEQTSRPPFDPLAPLLPEELCWIFDTALAYQVEWMLGSPLAHTVFTFLYAHALEILNPDFIPYDELQEDPARPLPLITIVLRAYVMGLLKCCGMAWTQLSTSLQEDTEDWQSDKCDVSLLEIIQLPYVLRQLDNARSWLENSGQVTPTWRDALVARLSLNKTMLLLMSCDMHRNLPSVFPLIEEARRHLNAVQTNLPPTPPPNTLAHLAFDPYIARRLNTFIPVRVITLRPIEETFRDVGHMIERWEEVASLTVVPDLTIWRTVGDLRLWLPGRPNNAYTRSLYQSAFYTGVLYLGRYDSRWILDRFFLETLGMRYDHVRAILTNCCEGIDLTSIDRSIAHNLPLHIKAQWANPPRRRRYLSRSVVEWHALYDTLEEVVSRLLPSLPDPSPVRHLHKAPLLWILRVQHEIVVDGQQLDLYAPTERSFAFWYAAKIASALVRCIDGLVSILPEDSQARRDLRFERDWYAALRIVWTGVYMLTSPLRRPWQDVRANFYRRWKWAFVPDFDAIDVPLACPPDYDRFMVHCARMTRSALPSEGCTPSEGTPQRACDGPGVLFRAARDALVNLEEKHLTSSGGLWVQDQRRMVQITTEACERLAEAPSSIADIPQFDQRRLKWDASVHPWLPKMAPSMNAQP
ncbi:Mak10 subunit, NatC N-terminal acetyltransferase-domain-containing protein [Schizophyllum fasciatum]